MRHLKFLPVVERELRIAARGRGIYRWRTGVVGAALGLMALLTTSISANPRAPEMLGPTLFYALVGISAAYAFGAGVSVTADCVSREKREGTLGLLFLTDLRGMDIVLGKLAASSLNTVYGLLGLVPLLAIPVMLGGVPIRMGLLASAGVLNLLFVSVSLGIAVSTLSWDERRATFASVIGGILLLFLPFAAGGVWIWMTGRGPLEALVLSAMSPLIPILCALPSPGAGGVSVMDGILLPALLVPSHAMGWLALVTAGWRAGAVWQSRGAASARRTVDERVFTPRDPARRAGSRRRLLDVHPLVWLIERHPAKRFYADGLVLAIIAIWYRGYQSYGTAMFGGPTWFLVVPLAFTVHLIFASWVIAESSMRLISDRRSGALELLLCSGMSDHDLVEGHRLALRRLFLRPILVLAAAEVFIAFHGFGVDDDTVTRNGRWMMLGLAFAVFCDIPALSWISLRLASSLPTVNRVGALALLIAPGGHLVVAALVAAGAVWITRHGVGLEFPFYIQVWMVSVAVVDGVAGFGFCRRWVLREFRRAAVRIQPRAAVEG